MSFKRMLYWLCFLVPYVWIAFFYNNIPNEVFGIGKAVFIGYCFAANLLIVLFLSYRLKHMEKQSNLPPSHKFNWAVMTVINIVPLLLVLYAAEFSLGFNLPKMISLICGFIFLIFAFYFPKIKQNEVIGIKTKWTLKSEDVWNKTHRAGAAAWIIGGALFIGNIFSASEQMYVLNIVLGLCFVIVVPYVYSFIIWNKEQKNEQIKS